MSATTASDQRPPSAAIHDRCLLCGRDHPTGFHLRFHLRVEDDAVIATVPSRQDLIGFPGILHGGIVAAVLDAAMTNWLFAHDVVALTAELTVRYHRPVPADRELDLSAHRRGQGGNTRLHELAAVLRLDGQLLASSKARFLQPPADAPPPWQTTT